MKRILVKLSGEQLAGAGGSGIDHTVVQRIAGEIRQAKAQIVVMIGGGNFVRGATLAGDGLQRVTADFMGMLSTMINGLALADIFTAHNLPARVLTAVKADQVADFYTQRRALNHLKKDRVVIIAGGTGRPYLTTDTAAVNLALELGCDMVCKVTKVDGVYTKDPAKFADATHLPHITFKQALEDPAIRVMDKAAVGLALEYNIPIVVCDLHTPGNLQRLAAGQHVGTRIAA